MAKTRSYVVTNWNCDHQICEDLVKSDKVRFIAYGEETCPTSGRKHFQTYIVFSNQKHPSAKVLQKIGRMFGPIHCNVQPMRGSLKSNAAYCSKESTLVKLGDEPKQGNRADLVDVVARIVNGEESAENICLTDPGYYHQYGRTLTKAEDVAKRKMYRTWMTEGEWYWGPTGVGKSHVAFAGYNAETHYVKPVLDEWWDGYTGQETVIINDFRGQIPFSELLNLVDKWPHYVKRRCREPTPFMARKVIVTSALPPEQVYYKVCEHSCDSIEQLNRRFSIIHLAQRCSEGNNVPLSKKRKLDEE